MPHVSVQLTEIRGQCIYIVAVGSTSFTRLLIIFSHKIHVTQNATYISIIKLHFLLHIHSIKQVYICGNVKLAFTSLYFTSLLAFWSSCDQLFIDYHMKNCVVKTWALFTDKVFKTESITSRLIYKQMLTVIVNNQLHAMKYTLRVISLDDNTTHSL